MKAILAGIALLALATAAVAAPPPAFLASPTAACAQAASSAPLLPFKLEGAPAPQAKTLCPDAECTTVNDCYQACPSAFTAACSNGWCYFNAPPPYGGGGGGGTGGGHLDCATDPCLDSSTCGVCNGRVGVCDASGTCQY